MPSLVGVPVFQGDGTQTNLHQVPFTAPNGVNGPGILAAIFRRQVDNVLTGVAVDGFAFAPTGSGERSLETAVEVYELSGEDCPNDGLVHSLQVTAASGNPALGILVLTFQDASQTNLLDLVLSENRGSAALASTAGLVPAEAGDLLIDLLSGYNRSTTPNFAPLSGQTELVDSRWNRGSTYNLVGVGSHVVVDSDGDGVEQILWTATESAVYTRLVMRVNPPDVQPPAVQFLSPDSGAEVRPAGARIVLDVAGTASDGVTNVSGNVEFHSILDGVETYLGGGPGTIVDTDGWADGRYTIRARYKDDITLLEGTDEFYIVMGTAPTGGGTENGYLAARAMVAPFGGF